MATRLTGALPPLDPAIQRLIDNKNVLPSPRVTALITETWQKIIAEAFQNPSFPSILRHIIFFVEPSAENLLNPENLTRIGLSTYRFLHYAYEQVPSDKKTTAVPAPDKDPVAYVLHIARVIEEHCLEILFIQVNATLAPLGRETLQLPRRSIWKRLAPSGTPYTEAMQAEQNRGRCLAVRELHFASSSLFLLPEALVYCQGLLKLHLEGNGLMFIPRSLGNVTSLLKIKLSDNDLERLPEEFRNLSSLQSLNLSSNAFSSVPPSVMELKALTSLDLSENFIAELPENFTQLGSTLQRLCLDDGKFTAFPEVLLECTSLTALKLSGNQISSLPDRIEVLSALTKLEVNRNGLTGLPPGLLRLPKLRNLYLETNDISSLPEEITATALKRLCLKENKLSAVPSSLGALSRLERLDLAKNPLTSLPRTLNQLSLTVLRIPPACRDNIKDFPHLITACEATSRRGSSLFNSSMDPSPPRDGEEAPSPDVVRTTLEAVRRRLSPSNTPSPGEKEQEERQTGASDAMRHLEPTETRTEELVSTPPSANTPPRDTAENPAIDEAPPQETPSEANQRAVLEENRAQEEGQIEALDNPPPRSPAVESAINIVPPREEIEETPPTTSSKETEPPPQTPPTSTERMWFLSRWINNILSLLEIIWVYLVDQLLSAILPQEEAEKKEGIKTDPSTLIEP